MDYKGYRPISPEPCSMLSHFWLKLSQNARFQLSWNYFLVPC